MAASQIYRKHDYLKKQGAILRWEFFGSVLVKTTMEK